LRIFKTQKNPEASQEAVFGKINELGAVNLKGVGCYVGELAKFLARKKGGKPLVRWP